MILSYLNEAVRSAAREAGFEPPMRVDLETPRDRAHGDLATNLAMQLAKEARTAPRAVAEAIVARLQTSLDPARVSQVSVAGPGFINFTLSPELVRGALEDILAQGGAYGRSDWGQGRAVLLEYVSANPTGPMNVVSARAAAVGDSLTRLFRACGFDARSEFYVNDAGNQVRLLGESLLARLKEADGEAFEIPENGYQGEYLRDLAQAMSPQERSGLRALEAGTPGACARHALTTLQARQRQDLERFGVHFDRFFLETELHAAGEVERALRDLESRGLIFEQDGARWFASTRFGDDKDRVVMRANGEPTYFLADAAYHRSKHERGFELALDFFGPDHHGTIPRLMAAVEALGYSKEWLEVRIIQQVNLHQGGKAMDMSKRKGILVTLGELLDDVGADVARFFFLMRGVSTHLDFDLDLAREHSDKNPVYYVQYAHARVCSVERFAAENGIQAGQADLARLQEPEELTLIKTLMQLPLMVELAVRSREPQRMTQYLIGVAQDFHPFYQRHRVVTDDPALSAARLRLVQGVRLVLANGLKLIGISAPERM